ncbi:ClpP family protease [Actinophytocola sp. NPDC049390]|uniref:ClpP family protease n=1 Tax=Actinophytocola sp. NPDC049390 TaxID=3363894 RepID=UPI003794579C
MEPYEERTRNRIIMVRGEIDDDMANRVTAELLLLADADPAAEITLHIASPGGMVTAGMAIHDTMALIEPPVATYAVGTVGGTAQVLLTAGTPGRRYALPHVRIHLVRITAGERTAPVDPAEQDLILTRWHWEMTMLTAEATGQPVEQVNLDAERHRVFTAHEAVAYGLVDHVVDGGGRVTW